MTQSRRLFYMATYVKIEDQVYEVRETNIPVSSADVQLQMDDIQIKIDELVALKALLAIERNLIIIAENEE